MQAYFPVVSVLGMMLMLFGLVMGFPLAVSFALDDGATAAYDLAMSLAHGPTVTLGYMKQNLNLAEIASFEMSLDAEALQQTRAMSTADHKEAARAFVEKRAPVFKGA